MGKRRLRTGYTTGTCAAAAAKAATLLLTGEKPFSHVEVTLPDGSCHQLPVKRLSREKDRAVASVIKDAGDDPDVTNGAEIVATVRWLPEDKNIHLRGGPGVGVVTKPGLPVPVGEPAINPVPRKMILEAVREVLGDRERGLEVTISVPRGEELARKTLNPRLGIVGGISILGTTGIVKPLSSEAWLATIETSLRVARAVGLSETVLSFGRSSELAHMKRYRFPEEAYILMGDFLEFTLKVATKEGFRRIHLVGQWAKLLKCALVAENPPQVSEPYGFTTHVRHGVVKPEEALAFLRSLGLPEEFGRGKNFNTVREIFEALKDLSQALRSAIFKKVLSLSRRLAARWAPELEIRMVLVSYRREVIFEL